MSSLAPWVTQLLAGLALLFVGAMINFALARVGVRMGWSREDRIAQDGKIERIDHHARESINRVEKELGQRLGQVERTCERLDERIRHLPTADDIDELNRRLAGVESGLSGATAKIEGQTEMVRTIRDHIMAGERRG